MSNCNYRTFQMYSPYSRLALLAFVVAIGLSCQADLASGEQPSSLRTSRKAGSSTVVRGSKSAAPKTRMAVTIQSDEEEAVSQAGCKNCQANAGVSVAPSEFETVAEDTELIAADFVSSDESCTACDRRSCLPWGISLFRGCQAGCDSAGCGPCSPLGLLSRRLYMRAEAASFWGSGQFLPTLVTTSVGQPLPPVDEAGILGDADTRSLFGGSEVGANTINGIRYEVGLWFDDCRTKGFQVRLFDTGENDVNLQTDGTRQAVIARNFLDVGPPQEQSLVSIAYPNQTSGSILANLSSKTNGGDLLLRHVLSQDHLVRCDWLMGYQTARLSESLDIVSNTTNLNAPNPILDQEDHFQARSQFQGATFGFSGEAREGNWYLGSLFKLGFGNMERRVDISGFSRTTVGSDISTQNQGLLARQTNIGTYRDDTFVIVPELGLHIGYRLTNKLDFTIGYSMLRLPKVSRVVDSLDPNLASNLSDPLVGEIRPSFTLQESNFTLHSLNLGLQWAY